MISVANRITVYEVNGKEGEPSVPRPEITVTSHWNRNNFVTIEIEGQRYTVVANDLLAAIQNAKNSGSR